MTASLLFCIASIVHAHNTTHTHKQNSRTGESDGYAVLIVFVIFAICAYWSGFVQTVCNCCEAFWGWVCSLPHKCIEWIKSTCRRNNVTDVGIEIVSV